MAAFFFLWAGFGLGGEFWELLLLQEACKEYKMALEKAVFFKISVKGDGLDRSSLAEWLLSDTDPAVFLMCLADSKELP